MNILEEIYYVIYIMIFFVNMNGVVIDFIFDEEVKCFVMGERRKF